MSRMLAVFLWLVFFVPLACAQSMGNAGTIEGTVTDPSGAPVAKAVVMLHNSVTGYRQSTASSTEGTFRFSNIPPNPYHLEVRVPGFAPFTMDLAIRGSIPVAVKATLALAGDKTSINVEGAEADLIEVDPSAHTDADRSLIV